MVPELHKQTWEATRDLLVAATKPIIVSPLVEPGMVGRWSVRDLPEKARSMVENEFANAQNYFTEKLKMSGLDRIERIVLDSNRGELHFPVAELHCWLQDYMVTVGITIFPTLDPTLGQLIVVRPGGGGPVRTPRPEPTWEHVHDHDHGRP